MCCTILLQSASSARLSVPERTLFFWALIGGGPGVYATMLIIRHKTLHHIFMLGIPAIMILQGAIIVGIYNILYMKGLL